MITLALPRTARHPRRHHQSHEHTSPHLHQGHSGLPDGRWQWLERDGEHERGVKLRLQLLLCANAPHCTVSHDGDTVTQERSLVHHVRLPDRHQQQPQQ